MTLRKAAAFGMFTCLLVPAVLLARQNIVRNGSMESGQGPAALDPHFADQWTWFGGANVERSDTVNLVPTGAGHALKAFGDGENTYTGGSQIVLAIDPNQSVTASVQLYTPANDKLGGSGQAGLVLEFLNRFDGTIPVVGYHEVFVLNSTSTADTWIPASITFTAPANTAKVRVSCKLQWAVGNISGAAYWDDARLTVNGGSNRLLNGDFETMGHSVGQSSVGIDEWTGFNDQEKSSDVAYDGSASLKLGAREAYSGLYQFMNPLADGDEISMLAYVWNPATGGLSGDSRAGIKLEFNPNGEVPPAVENLAFTEASDPNVWTLVTLDTTVPAMATSARVVCIYVADATTTGSVYFEYAWAEVETAPGVNQLQNASFEDGLGGPNGLDYWTEFNSDVSSTEKACFEVPELDPNAGICTAKATGTAVAGIYQEFALPANPEGKALSIHAYLYTPEFDRLTGATAKAGVKVEWVLGSVPPDVDIGPSNNTIDATAPTNTWIPLTIDFTMPTGSNAVPQFTNLIEKGSATSGKVYFDACEAVVINKFDGCDWDADDDEDLVDFARLQLVYGSSPLKWGALVFDSDDNGAIDMTDFNYFAPRMLGPQQ